jgi:hypothetical protein
MTAYIHLNAQISTMLLALHLIADGIPVDLHYLMKIKLELARIIGFTDVVVIPKNGTQTFYVTFSDLPTIPEIALPCIHDLPRVLDAGFQYILPTSTMGGPYAEDDTPVPLLVGSALADVSLICFCALPQLELLPIATTKSLLESLIIIVYKHDLDSRPLKHLQLYLRKAVNRAMQLMLSDLSYEIRQLALLVAQAFVKKWPNSLNTVILCVCVFSLLRAPIDLSQ